MMKEDRRKKEPEKIREEVENYVDYLWLMRSFQEELAKEAQDLLQQVKIHRTRNHFTPARTH